MKPTDIHGWMSERELATLGELAHCASSWLEVGAWCGRSTLAVAQHLPHGAVLAVVDPFCDFIPIYEQVIRAGLI